MAKAQIILGELGGGGSVKTEYISGTWPGNTQLVLQNLQHKPLGLIMYMQDGYLFFGGEDGEIYSNYYNPPQVSYHATFGDDYINMNGQYGSANNTYVGAYIYEE